MTFLTAKISVIKFIETYFFLIINIKNKKMLFSIINTSAATRTLTYIHTHTHKLEQPINKQIKYIYMFIDILIFSSNSLGILKKRIFVLNIVTYNCSR